jgi:WD40 repeat protein
MSTSRVRRSAALLALVVAAGGFFSHEARAKEVFCAVGWYGDFTWIDPTVGQVAPTRNDLPEHLQTLARSPGGTLFAGRDGALYTLDPFTGDTLLFLSLDDIDLHGMAFSTSGDLYVAGGETGEPDTLQIIDICTGTYLNAGVLWGDVDEAQGLAFSPDGKLYGVGPDDGTVGTYDLFTIDLDDAETHLIGSGDNADLSQSLVFTRDGRLYALGHEQNADATWVSFFARIDPHDGSTIGPVFSFPGDYRGLELVPEPATLLLLGLGGVAALSWRRPTRRA